MSVNTKQAPLCCLRGALPGGGVRNDQPGNPKEDSSSLCRTDKRRKDASVLLRCYGCGLVSFAINHKATPLLACRGVHLGEKAKFDFAKKPIKDASSLTDDRSHLLGAGVLATPHGYGLTLLGINDKANPPRGSEGGSFLGVQVVNSTSKKPLADNTSLGRPAGCCTEADVPLGGYGCKFMLISSDQKQPPLAADGRGALFEVLPSGCYLEASMETSMSIGRVGRSLTGPSVLRGCDIRKFAVSAVTQNSKPLLIGRGAFSKGSRLTGATPLVSRRHL